MKEEFKFCEYCKYGEEEYKKCQDYYSVMDFTLCKLHELTEENLIEDDECRIDFNQYRCKGCDHYYTCFDNETAAEVDAMQLHRAMQGEPLEKIFS